MSGLQWLAIATAVLVTGVFILVFILQVGKVLKKVLTLVAAQNLKISKFLKQFQELLECQQRMEGLLESSTKAVVNLELRKMQTSLSGAEASRLIAAAVGEYTPMGLWTRGTAATPGGNWKKSEASGEMCATREESGSLKLSGAG